MSRAEYPLKDGRIITFDSSYSSYISAMFTENTLGIFDEAGSIPSDNLTTDPTWINGDADWIERTVGDASSVSFAEGNTHLYPQETDPQLVINGNFTLGGGSWVVDESHPQSNVTFTNGQCTLTANIGAAEFAGISQAVSTTQPNTVHTAEIGSVAGSTVTLRIGTGPDDGTYYEDTNYSGGEVSFTPPLSDFYISIYRYDGGTAVVDDVVIAQTAVGEAGISQSVATTHVGDLHAVRVGTNSTQEYRIRVGTAEGDGTYLDVYTSSGSATAAFTPTASPFFITVDAYGDVSDDVLLTSIYAWFKEPDDSLAFWTPYLDEELRELYFVPTPEESTAYVLHPNHPPYKLTRGVGGIYTFTEVVFTSPPADWVVGNYPSCGTYFQGRLWLGGTNIKGQTFWASKSGLPENFDLGSAQPDEAMEFTLAKFGRIEWMIGTKNLLIGTVNGEHIVTSEGGVIIPDDISVEQQSSYGSKSVQPLQVGDQVFYVSPDGLKVRAIQYQWEANNWLSRDLTFFSDHITKSGIRSLAWAQHPDQLLWCALEDGTAACLSYERGEEIYGWHRHDTQGYFREFAVGDSYGTSQLLALIQREDGDLFLEIQEPESAFDGFLQATYVGAEYEGMYFTGYDHLIGKQVQVILDGALHPDVFVDATGGITTEWAAHECSAGLKYTPSLQTLPFDKRAETGSAQPYQKRYNSLEVTFLDSAIPTINGERPPTRHPATPMDEREPDSDGAFRTETIVLGWDHEAIVTIEQELPLKCTVLSIAGEMAQEIL